MLTAVVLATTIMNDVSLLYFVHFESFCCINVYYFVSETKRHCQCDNNLT